MENKERADTRKETIAKSFQMALGCPVQVNLSLAACAQEGSQDREIVENAHPDPTHFYKKSQKSTKKAKSQRNEGNATILAELSANEKDPSLVDKICRSISSHNPKAGLTTSNHLLLMRNSSSGGSLTRCSTIDEKPRSNSTHYSSQAHYVVMSQRALDRREDEETIAASSMKKERSSTQQSDMDPINAAKSIVYNAKNGPSLKMDTRVSTTNCQSFSVHEEPSSDHMESR